MDSDSFIFHERECSSGLGDCEWNLRPIKVSPRNTVNSPDTSSSAASAWTNGSPARTDLHRTAWRGRVVSAASPANGPWTSTPVQLEWHPLTDEEWGAFTEFIRRESRARRLHFLGSGFLNPRC